MFIYTHTKIIPEFIAIFAMPSSQYIIISGLIRDLQLTAEHQIQLHADMIEVRLLLHHTLMKDRGIETACVGLQTLLKNVLVLRK